MSRPSSWSQLAHLPRARLERLQEAAQRRFLREELPLAARYEELALERRAPQALPTTTAAELAADPLAFVLRPRPGPLRTHWPFARKLALSLAGARSRALLHHSYGIVRVERDAVPGGASFELRSTAHDLDLAAEAGARCLDLLELARPGARALCALPLEAGATFWQIALGVPRAAAHCELSGGLRQAGICEHLHRLAGCEALIATPGLISRILAAAVATRTALPELRSLVLVTRRVGPQLRERLARLAAQAGLREPRLAWLAPLPGMRLALAGCPTPIDASPSGLHVFPDFLWVEACAGQLVVTNLAAHGSAPLRFESGLRLARPLEHEACPHCARTLMRIPWDLAPFASSGLGEELDGIDELLAWRATAAGALELVVRAGADAAALVERVGELARAAGHPETPMLCLQEDCEMLDWLGSPTEREEQHVVGPQRA